MAEAFPQGYFGALPNQNLESIAQIERTHIGGRRYFVEFIKSLPQNAVLLDAGCGAGKTIRTMLALRPDITIKAMDFADTRDYLPSNVSFIKGSVEELGSLYEPNQFDAVVCQHVIEHLIYPLDLITGIKTVLKPGGKVFIETPNWTRLFVPFSHLWFWNDYTHIRPFSRMTMARLMNEYALTIECLTTFSSVRWFSPARDHSSEGKSSIDSAVSTNSGKKVQGRGMIARGFSRLVNPLLCDTLIVIAQKPS